MKKFILLLAALSFPVSALADSNNEKRDSINLPAGPTKSTTQQPANSPGVDKSSVNAGQVKHLIAKVVRINELYGDEDGPSTEEDCLNEYSSQLEISACLEMLGLRSSVVSSRRVPTKKAPGNQGSGDLDKPSMDFKTD